MRSVHIFPSCFNVPLSRSVRLSRRKKLQNSNLSTPFTEVTLPALPNKFLRSQLVTVHKTFVRLSLEMPTGMEELRRHFVLGAVPDWSSLSTVESGGIWLVPVIDFLP